MRRRCSAGGRGLRSVGIVVDNGGRNKKWMMLNERARVISFEDK